MKKSTVICLGGVAVAAFIGGQLANAKMKESEYGKLSARLAKFEDYFAISNKWIKNKNMGISVLDYFERNGYESVAIYGMGELGKRLYEELKNQGKTVTFVMDRKASGIDPGLRICGIDDEIPEVDVIVITPTFDYASIEEQLKKVTSAKIISIKDVVMG